MKKFILLLSVPLLFLFVGCTDGDDIIEDPFSECQDSSACNYGESGECKYPGDQLINNSKDCVSNIFYSIAGMTDETGEIITQEDCHTVSLPCGEGYCGVNSFDGFLTMSGSNTPVLFGAVSGSCCVAPGDYGCYGGFLNNQTNYYARYLVQMNSDCECVCSEIEQLFDNQGQEVDNKNNLDCNNFK